MKSCMRQEQRGFCCAMKRRLRNTIKSWPPDQDAMAKQDAVSARPEGNRVSDRVRLYGGGALSDNGGFGERHGVYGRIFQDRI